MDWASDPEGWLERKRTWDKEHYKILRRWKKQGFRPRTVIDIGANIGEWSEMADALFQPEHLILFEPQSCYADTLKERSKASACSWTIRREALGDRIENGELRITTNRAASSLLPPMTDGLPANFEVCQTQTENIAIQSLDALYESGVLKECQLMKIDVQGFESKVILGGEKFMKRVERLVVEVSLRPVYQGQPLLPEIMETCGRLGFILDDISEASRSWPDGVLWQVDLWFIRRSIQA